MLSGNKKPASKLINTNNKKPLKEGKLSLHLVDSWMKNLDRDMLRMQKNDADLIQRINESHSTK